MYIVMKPDELIHYGVKGMRWGVRKDSSSEGSRGAKIAKIVSPVGYAIGKGVKKTSNTIKTSKKVRSAKNSYRNLTGSRKSSALKKYRNKNIDGMSDKDLRNAVNRMNLEKQYRDLTKIQFRRGQNAVNQMYGTHNAMNRTVKSVKKIAIIAATG